MKYLLGLSTDLWLDILTASLVLVGVLQFIAFVVQARRLGQTITAMRATEARQQLTDRTQLRAWIGIDAIRLSAPNLNVANYTPPDTKQIGFEVSDEAIFGVRNFGRTPANRVQIVARWIAAPPHQRPGQGNHWRPFTIDADAPIRQTWTRPTIFPDQALELELPITDLGLLRSAVEGTATTYLYGELTYTDIYGKDGSTQFCFVYSPGRAPGEQFVPYEERNEAR